MHYIETHVSTEYLPIGYQCVRLELGTTVYCTVCPFTTVYLYIMRIRNPNSIRHIMTVIMYHSAIYIAFFLVLYGPMVKIAE